MYTHYVYLIVSQRRIVVLPSPVKDEDYVELLQQQASNRHTGECVSKSFAAGIVMGSKHLGGFMGPLKGGQVVNELDEFAIKA